MPIRTNNPKAKTEMKHKIHKTSSAFVAALKLMGAVITGTMLVEVLRLFMWMCYDAGIQM